MVGEVKETMEKSLKIEIRVTDGNGGYTFAGATHTLHKEGASYGDLLRPIEGGPLDRELDAALVRVKKLLSRVNDVSLPDMLDFPDGVNAPRPK